MRIFSFRSLPLFFDHRIFRSLFFVLGTTLLILIFSWEQPNAADKSWFFEGKDGNNVHTIQVPDDGYLDFKIEYDNSALTLSSIEFENPNKCSREHGWNLVPTTLYGEHRNPISGRYYNVNIPTGPDSVDVNVYTDANSASASYKLSIYYSEPLAWGKDIEPNAPFHTPQNLGTIIAPESIPSRTNFYKCFWQGIEPIPVGESEDDTQTDRKDYFQFKVFSSKFYKLVYRRLEGGDEDCDRIVSLSDADNIYIHFKWYLEEEKEIGPYYLVAGEDYFLDLQLVFSANHSFPRHCSASVELGLIPVGEPWLSIEDIDHPESTVCGVDESYSANIKNDGDADTWVEATLKLYSHDLPHTIYRKTLPQVLVKARETVPVTFNPIIPDNGTVLTGDWFYKISADPKEFGWESVSKQTKVEILCQPPSLPYIMLLLMRKEFKDKY